MDPSYVERFCRHPIIFVFVAVLGACTGSFLNVVIYRLPRNLSVNHPKRSFCPSCKTQIPWYRNLPLVSWLLLRGRCAECKVPISPRYILVEAITGLLFVLVWSNTIHLGWGVSVAFFVLVSLLLAATFIDFEHYIIPDGITWGGAAAGLVFATLLPLLASAMPSAGIIHPGATPPGGIPHPLWWRSSLLALAGAASGYALLWSVVQLGKLAFGRRVHQFESDQPWKIHEPKPDAEPQLEVGAEVYPWSDLFARSTDQLVIEASTDITLDGRTLPAGQLRFFYDRLVLAGETIPLEQVKVISGSTRKIVQPREAMGFGDVKFVAMIGTFLGWQGAVFSLIGGALLGSVTGVIQKTWGGERWAKPIPFGPYLALAAFLFLLYGEHCIDWYLRLARLR